MLSLRTAKPASVIWATILLAGWIGWPSTGCFCADGGFRFFCDAHNHSSSSASVYQTSDGQPGCCGHSRPVAQGNCCDRSSPGGRGVSNPGCTHVIKSSAITVSVASKPIATNDLVALGTLPVAPGPTPAARVANQSLKIDTGPPADLVISLHQLLI